MITQNINYLLRSIANIGQKKKCPFCGGTDFKKTDSKYIFTSLQQCLKCKLEHRHPKDDKEWLRQFYQKEYAIETQMMTKLPSDAEIEKYKENDFSSLRSYQNYIDALFKRSIGIKVIDYGCSWGYNVYKLLKSGNQAVGFEISIPRAEFGKEKLSIEIYSDPDLLPEENDLVLSSHVVEHLDNINDFISLSCKLLKKDGIFMAFCPNGSEPYKNREPKIWHVNWGAVHPNSLSVEFAKYAFRNNPYLILTGDWSFDSDKLAQWDGLSQITSPYQAGKELLIISKPNIQI